MGTSAVDFYMTEQRLMTRQEIAEMGKELFKLMNGDVF